MKDITYCTCRECSFKSCERHIKNLPQLKRSASFADLYKVCDRYIRYLLDSK